MSSNPLIDDSTVAFLLYAVLDVEKLCEEPVRRPPRRDGDIFSESDDDDACEDTLDNMLALATENFDRPIKNALHKFGNSGAQVLFKRFYFIAKRGENHPVKALNL